MGLMGREPAWVRAGFPPTAVHVGSRKVGAGIQNRTGQDCHSVMAFWLHRRHLVTDVGFQLFPRFIKQIIFFELTLNSVDCIPYVWMPDKYKLEIKSV